MQSHCSVCFLLVYSTCSMRQFLLTFLLILTAATSLSFGGMVLMDHETGMMMPVDGCAAGSCETSNTEGMDGTTCLSHCIRATTVSNIVPMGASVQALVLFFIAILFVNLFDKNAVSRFFRSDNDIGKILLHRQLSTVIIRD